MATTNPASSFSSESDRRITGKVEGATSEGEAYQPKDAIGSTIKATTITGTAGLFVSAIQTTLTKQNVGAFSVFTRTGGTIAVFGMYTRRKEGRWETAEANVLQRQWVVHTNSRNPLLPI